MKGSSVEWRGQSAVRQVSWVVWSDCSLECCLVWVHLFNGAARIRRWLFNLTSIL